MLIVRIIVFGFIALAIIAMVVLAVVYKGFRSVKEAQEEFIKTGGRKFNRQEYIRYQKDQREKNPFGKDYFKSSGSSKKEEPKAQQKTTTTRRTTTSSGVTIIDDRETEEKKKIFDHDDGEYVEYEEV